MTTRERLLEIIDRFGDTRSLLYGDLVLDRFILGTPKRISREAPVIILRHEGQRDVPGGGANALANLAALDVRVVPVGVVGDDEPGEALLAALARAAASMRRRSSSSPVTAPRPRSGSSAAGRRSLKHQVARYDIEDRLPADGPWRGTCWPSLERRMHAGRSGGGLRLRLRHGRPGRGRARARRATAAAAWICADSRHRIGELARRRRRDAQPAGARGRRPATRSTPTTTSPRPPRTSAPTPRRPVRARDPRQSRA